MVYGEPRGSCLIVYSPFSLVIVLVLKPVDSFFTVTVAPMAAPVFSSETLPEIMACVPLCKQYCIDVAQQHTKGQKSCKEFSHAFWFWLRNGWLRLWSWSLKKYGWLSYRHNGPSTRLIIAEACRVKLYGVRNIDY